MSCKKTCDCIELLINEVYTVTIKDDGCCPHHFGGEQNTRSVKIKFTEYCYGLCEPRYRCSERFYIEVKENGCFKKVGTITVCNPKNEHKCIDCECVEVVKTCEPICATVLGTIRQNCNECYPNGYPVERKFRAAFTNLEDLLEFIAFRATGFPLK